MTHLRKLARSTALTSSCCLGSPASSRAPSVMSGAGGLSVGGNPSFQQDADSSHGGRACKSGMCVFQKHALAGVASQTS